MNIIMVFGTLGFFLCLFVMYGTSHGIPGIQKYDSSFRLLDMRFSYNSEILYDTFKEIGQAGIRAYKNYLLLDFGFITCFLIVMIGITLKIANNNIYRNVMIWFAVLRSLLDVLENTLLIYLLNIYPNQSTALADFCSWVTTLKFVMMLLWIIGIIFIFAFKL